MIEVAASDDATGTAKDAEAIDIADLIDDPDADSDLVGAEDADAAAAATVEEDIRDLTVPDGAEPVRVDRFVTAALLRKLLV